MRISYPQNEDKWEGQEFDSIRDIGYPTSMQHYYGIEALCKRLGVASYSGLRLQVARAKVPIYQRFCKRGKMKFPKNILYSNELLLMTWELEQARKNQERFISGLEAQHENRRVAHKQRKVASGLPCRSYRRQYLDNSAV